MSNRVSVLAALIKHGKSTLEELHEFTGIDKNVLRYSVNDAKKAGHIEVGKDTVTNAPAYTITPFGRKWYDVKLGENTGATQLQVKKSKEFEEAESVAAKSPSATVTDPDNDAVNSIIKGMVNRFLSWKLPENFGPDCYISFDRKRADEYREKFGLWPVGTNLFTADQALAMFKHCLPTDLIAPAKTTVTLSVDTQVAQEELALLKKQLNDQDELLTSQFDTIASWKKAASSVGIETPEMLVKVFNEQDIRLTDQIRKTNEALQQASDAQAAVERTALRAMEGMSSMAEALKPDAYTVAIPKKPLRRFTKLETAQSLALGAVRAGSQAEVYALHLVGKAVRGAEWKPA